MALLLLNLIDIWGGSTETTTKTLKFEYAYKNLFQRKRNEETFQEVGRVRMRNILSMECV